MFHCRNDSGEDEDFKIIGVYHSSEKAREVISEFKLLKGFKDYPDGFLIDEYELNKDNWTEGFGVD